MGSVFGWPDPNTLGMLREIRKAEKTPAPGECVSNTAQPEQDRLDKVI